MASETNTCNNSHFLCPLHCPHEIKSLEKISSYLDEGSDIRITLVGVSGSGKTSFKQSMKTVMTCSSFEVDPNIGGPSAGQSSRYLTQSDIPLPKKSKLVVTDMVGLFALDDIDTLVEDLQDIYCGIFPYHLLHQRAVLRLFSKKIVQKFQHQIVLVISAVDASEETSAEFKYVVTLARKLSESHLSFVIVLPHVDHIASTEADVIDKVTRQTNKHAAFVLPVVNCTQQDEHPSDQTVEGIHRAIARIVYCALHVQNDFQPTFGMRVIRHYRNNRRWFLALASDLLGIGRELADLKAPFVTNVLLALVALLIAILLFVVRK